MSRNEYNSPVPVTWGKVGRRARKPYYQHYGVRGLWRTPGIGKRVIPFWYWTLKLWKIGVEGWNKPKLGVEERRQ